MNTFACALPSAELAARRQHIIGPLIHAAEQTLELPDGYRLVFPGQPEWLARLAELIAFERACCPFLTFELVCEPEQGPITLNIRGPEGAKAMLGSELSNYGFAIETQEATA